MGMGNLGVAMKQPNVEIAAVCDVYQPHLEKAVAATARGANGKAARHHRFPPDPGRQEHRRGLHLYPRSLASLHDRRSLQGGQRRLRRKTDLRRRRRGPQDGASRAQIQPRGAGRHYAALRRPLPESLRDRTQRPARKNQLRANLELQQHEGGRYRQSARWSPIAGLDWEMWLGPRRNTPSTPTASVSTPTPSPISAGSGITLEA